MMTFSMQNGSAVGNVLAKDYRPTSAGVNHGQEAVDEGGSRSVHPERNVLDKFATVYVPSWLQSIPKSLYDVPLPPLPLPVDPNQAAEVFPRPFLDNIYPPMLGSFGLDAITPPDQDANIPKLHENAGAYLNHFSSLLAMEQEELRQAAGRQVIYGVPITKLPLKPSQTGPTLWQLRIPGTREDSPRLFINDRLRIRGLYRQLQTATETAVQARITGTIKRDGLVFFECPALEAMDNHLRHHPSGGSSEYVTAFPALGVRGQPQLPTSLAGVGPEYMVEFYPSTDALIAMHNALRRVASCLARSPIRTPTDKWLFPSLQDIRQTMSRPDFELKPFATRNNVASIEQPPLNEQQKLAIKRVVGAHRTVPYLIVGPPGTGKTKTMVELVLQILAHHEDAHILLTAPSNPAADTLALRLARYLDNKTMLRLQSSTRTFAETPNEILSYSCILNNTFVVPPWAQLLQYRVVVVDCLDAELLTMAKATNAEMLGLEHWTLRALGRKKSMIHMQALHWTHLLVDEAGQASEPELHIPLAAVAIGPEETDMMLNREPQVVICGDIKQLPAIITSSRARSHALDVSLMERLQERTIYDLKANIQSDSVNIIRLINNYRSHPGILLLPSTIFYDDALEPVADVALSQWPELPNKRLPMLIKGIEADEDWIDEGASFFNMSEIAEVVRAVRSLVNGVDGYQQREIGVVTPWREQVWRIRLKLREAGYHDVNVGNVEAYQGAEYRCVILSCVRSRDRFLQSDRENGMGLINEPKRFNVAITRAKELMIVIGNMNCHKVDSHWAALLQIATRHEFYVGPRLKNFDVTGDYISRLESRIYPETNDNTVDASMQALLISGSVAREALLED